jgi:hypothetical protein
MASYLIPACRGVLVIVPSLCGNDRSEFVAIWRMELFSVEGERFRKGGVMSYLRIGKCLFARFKMLPATYVLIRVYNVSSTVAMVRSGHFFPLGFSPSRRRTVSMDDSIFYLVT